VSALLAAGLELQPSDFSMRFWITDGFDNLGTVRGTDVVIDGVAGRYVSPISRVSDILVIGMRGWVRGSGNNDTVAMAAYRASMDALLVVLDPSLAPFLIEVHTPLMGIGASLKRSLNARFLNAIWSDVVDDGDPYRFVSVTFECVDSPPVWVEASE
jgi:hypothetical protein